MWGADLADMQLISKFHKGFRFFLCLIDIFRKYAWVIALNDKKGVSIDDAFPKILKECNRKPNKIWVNKGSEFSETRVQLKKKRGKVHIANFINAKRLPNATGGCCESPSGSRAEPWMGAKGAKPLENFAYFPLKMP